MKVNDITIGTKLFKPSNTFDILYIEEIIVSSIEYIEKPYNNKILEVNKNIKFSINKGKLVNSEYFFNEEEALKLAIYKLNKSIEPLQEKIKDFEKKLEKYK